LEREPGCDDDIDESVPERPPMREQAAFDFAARARAIIERKRHASVATDALIRAGALRNHSAPDDED
jgi:hypothetical protein